MTTGTAGSTPPEPSRPLTEREVAALARLAADARRDDPEWCDLLEAPPPRHRISPGVRNLVVQVVVVVVLAVLLMPTPWLGVMLAALVLIGPLAAALWAIRRGVL
jgi:hypothetical protein